MTWTILLPHEAREYSAAFDKAVHPIYYRTKRTSFWQRAAKRILRASIKHNPFIKKMELLTDEPELDQVKAIWLSDRIRLSKPETRQLLERLPKLQWIYSQRTGLDHLQLDLFHARGITISNTGNLISDWVAQMNLACILAQSKHLPLHITMQRGYRARSVFCEDITLQTVAIVGTGNIGYETARLCKAVGMHVIGLSRQPYGVTNDSYYDEIFDLDTDFINTIADADYVVMALPLNSDTQGIIDEECLAHMKSSASLINLARPGLIDENALLRSLRSRSISAAFVSLLDNVSRLNRFRASRFSNLIITHNSEAHLREKNQRAFEQFNQLLKKVMETGETGNRINQA